VHGHYADAGEVAALVASTMASTEACDMVMTGHSLGRNKLEHLLSSGGWRHPFHSHTSELCI
jgi:sucrose-phosphate synthase